ncbi:hypothetical protein F0U63_17990 [Cystobacter fuscus]|nr:hypothetical protein F0U63_17990 [Cystobacter fuscus]
MQQVSFRRCTTNREAVLRERPVVQDTRPESARPALLCLMSWSVNWDAFANYEFTNSHRPYLDALK